MHSYPCDSSARTLKSSDVRLCFMLPKCNLNISVRAFFSGSGIYILFSNLPKVNRHCYRRCQVSQASNQSQNQYIPLKLNKWDKHLVLYIQLAIYKLTLTQIQNYIAKHSTFNLVHSEFARVKCYLPTTDSSIQNPRNVSRTKNENSIGVIAYTCNHTTPTE